MRVVKPIRRVCHICGMEFDSNVTREWYCPECKGEARRRAREMDLIRKRNKRRIEIHQQERTGMSLAQYNTMMRERGRTYGGKPILRCTPREPKFLGGARLSWRKSDLESL